MPTQTIEKPAPTTHSETLTSGPWVVILYNDEIHSIDEVILQLQKATGCSLEKAVEITYRADDDGRAIAYDGALEECERAADVLRQIRLQVEVDQAC